MADSIEVSCEIPIQCEFIDEYENHDMVKHNLKEDVKLFNFITTFAQKISEGRDRNRKSVTHWNSFNFRLIFSQICYLQCAIVQNEANKSF
jgi:hypothetical protein